MADGKVKILIPVLGFGKSGGYRVLSILADELIKLGNVVTFLSSDFSNQPYFPTKADIIWVDSKGNKQLQPNDRPGNILKAILSLRKGYRMFERSNENVVILLTHPIITYFLPSDLRSKSIFYSQAFEPDYYYSMGGIKNFILGKISERSYNLGLFTIVNSPVFTNFKNLHSDRVVLPGIDFNIFHPVEHSIVNKGKITIGTIWRSESFKGADSIFIAIKGILEEFSNIEIRLAYCPETITNQIPDAVSVIPQNDFELADYYRSLDIYICAGNIHAGAFHYPVLEAMACGVAVVSTPYYLINEDNAFVVKMNDPESLRLEIRKAIQNQIIRLNKVKAALNEVSELTWSETGRKFMKYILEKRLQNITNDI